MKLADFTDTSVLPPECFIITIFTPGTIQNISVAMRDYRADTGKPSQESSDVRGRTLYCIVLLTGGGGTLGVEVSSCCDIVTVTGQIRGETVSQKHSSLQFGVYEIKLESYCCENDKQISACSPGEGQGL